MILRVLNRRLCSCWTFLSIAHLFGTWQDSNRRLWLGYANRFAVTTLTKHWIWQCFTKQWTTSMLERQKHRC